MSKRFSILKQLKYVLPIQSIKPLKSQRTKKVILYQNYYEFFVLLPVPNQIHCSTLEP
ncbi:MAG: hypothetical protein ACLUTV_05950 [Dorea longicatena]